MRLQLYNILRQQLVQELHLLFALPVIEMPPLRSQLKYQVYQNPPNNKDKTIIPILMIIIAVSLTIITVLAPSFSASVIVLAIRDPKSLPT